MQEYKTLREAVICISPGYKHNISLIALESVSCTDFNLMFFHHVFRKHLGYGNFQLLNLRSERRNYPDTYRIIRIFSFIFNYYFMEFFYKSFNFRKVSCCININFTVRNNNCFKNFRRIIVPSHNLNSSAVKFFIRKINHRRQASKMFI